MAKSTESRPPEIPAAPAVGPREEPRAPDGVVADQAAVMQALSGLFQTHEVRVLGIMGLLIGYICVFFAKIMHFEAISIGLIGVIATTALLLLLNNNINPRSFRWWIRSIAVIVLSIFFTSPQLYFAWTVSVAEAKLEANVAERAAIVQAQQRFVAPKITIENPIPGASP